METKKIMTILFFVLLFLFTLSPAVEAAFLDDFYTDTSANYTYSDSWNSGGSFTIDSGKLNITASGYNTASVMTNDPVTFSIGATLSLEVPAVDPDEGVLLMCSTEPNQPDGTSSYGFRFRRDETGGEHYTRMHLYPGGIDVDTLDPYPTEPATISIKRTSDIDFNYSIKTVSDETLLGSFTLSQLSGISDLHIGAQGIVLDQTKTYSVDNLKLEDYCGTLEHHPMDFNLDCYVNILDFAKFAGDWMDCTNPGCFDMRPFSIIIIPDTQVYSDNLATLDPLTRPFGQKEIFTQMTTWIKDNIEPLNIKFVLHMGDIVQCGDTDTCPLPSPLCDEGCVLTQWDNANEALSILDGNVPYSLVIGNHDMDPNESRNTTNFNNTFHYTRYVNEPWYGGRMEDPNDDFYIGDDGFEPPNDYDNVYHYFQAAGMDFLVVTLEVGPTDKMLEWASNVIAGHPNHRVILTTHSYLKRPGNLDGFNGECYHLPLPCCDKEDAACVIDTGLSCSNTGKNIWDKLVKCHENIDFVFSGHQYPYECSGLPLVCNWPAPGLRVSDVNGDTVYQFLCAEWADGWLWILTFSPEEDKIYVKTYSPWDPEDPNDQLINYGFELPAYNLTPSHNYELDPYVMD